MRPKPPRTAEPRVRQPGSIDPRDDAPAPVGPAIEVAPLTVREQPALGLAPREPITSLRWFGHDGAPVPLSTSQPRFTLGTGACDAVVPAALATGVSPLHALLERAPGALRIHDQDTPNGTFRSLDTPRLATLQIQAGESFWIAGTRLLALDTQLEVLRPRLALGLGLDRHAAVDEALALVAEGRPLALVGPTGTGAIRLALAIHRASPQRTRASILATEPPLPDLTAVRGATVLIDLDRVKLHAPWVRALFDPARGLRVMFTATDERLLRTALDTYRERVRTIALVPVRERRDELLRLLAHLWIDELRTARRPEELGPGLLAIIAYAWPGNLDELRAHARRLLAYLEHGGLRPAALALGIKHQTLAQHLQRIGFPYGRWSEYRNADKVRDRGLPLGLGLPPSASRWPRLHHAPWRAVDAPLSPALRAKFKPAPSSSSWKPPAPLAHAARRLAP